MTTDADRLDANVDYGPVGGYFVRIDVELPPDPGCRYPPPADGGVAGWLALSPDQAEAFAAKLIKVARDTRAARNGRNG